MMYSMTAAQFDLVYNSLSFTLASMMASTSLFCSAITTADVLFIAFRETNSGVFPKSLN